jgi:hypothetical protein
VSLAAGHAHHKKVKHLKPHAALLHCVSSPTTVPPTGQANVDQPPDSGTQYGPATCSTTGFGAGIMSDSFTVPDSGDMVGTYTQYFDGGTVKGTFDLPAGESPPIGTTGFYSQNFAGQITVTSGTGVYKGVKGKNSKGTMSCSSPDSVHFSCTENVTVLIPPPAASTGTTGASGVQH